METEEAIAISPSVPTFNLCDNDSPNQLKDELTISCIAGMEASPIESTETDEDMLSAEFSAAFLQHKSHGNRSSQLVANSKTLGFHQFTSIPSSSTLCMKRNQGFTSANSISSLGSISENSNLDTSSTQSSNHDISSNNSIDEDLSSPDYQSRPFDKKKTVYNGSFPCLQINLSQAHNPMICGCNNCQKTRSAFSANDIHALTCPRPRGGVASQRKRSSAISAKSKSSYLEQYKRRKEDYFRSRLTAEPVLAPMNMNRWSTYK